MQILKIKCANTLEQLQKGDLITVYINTYHVHYIRPQFVNGIEVGWHLVGGNNGSYIDFWIDASQLDFIVQSAWETKRVRIEEVVVTE